VTSADQTTAKGSRLLDDEVAKALDACEILGDMSFNLARLTALGSISDTPVLASPA
jgi:hypothetical protein